jgi:hypothetical protein
LFGALDETRAASLPADTAPADPAPTVEPAPAPSDAVEVSAAARLLGPECEERERIACTCPHAHAAGWCAEVRRDSAQAAAGPVTERTQERRLCQESAEQMRLSCLR